MINEKFSSTKIPTNCHLSEHIVVHLKSNCLDMIIIAVYFPPKSTAEAYLEFITNLELIFEHHPSSKFVIMGDFNLPHTLWSNPDDVVHCNFLNASNNEIDISVQLQHSMNYVNLIK